MVQGVTGDGQEDVEEGVVTAEGEHHKVEAEDEAAVLTAPLGVDGRVHHLVSGQVRSDYLNSSHTFRAYRKAGYLTMVIAGYFPANSQLAAAIATIV